MNFNILFFLFLFVFSGCGVKAPPYQHSEGVIDSYIEDYTKKEPTKPVAK